MHDPITWQDNWLSGLGAALVAGIAAAFVARLTVLWTQRGDRAAAELVESRRAAEALTRQADIVFGLIAKVQPGQSVPLEVWLSETIVQLPVVSDNELSRRVLDMSHDWSNFCDQLEQERFNDGYKTLNTGALRPVDLRAEQLADYKKALGERYKWVGRSLAAHRRGIPLPPREELRDLPCAPWVAGEEVAIDEG